MLEVTFVRRRGGRDRVYVARANGTSTAWDFPSYGDWLPHDLCHLVVEDLLRLANGFWGLVDQGVEVAVIDNQATLVRNDKRLVGQVGADLAGLNEAEAAVARLVSPPYGRSTAGEIAEVLGAELPESATPEAIAAIRDRLRLLSEQWRHLEDGAAIKLAFSRHTT